MPFGTDTYNIFSLRLIPHKQLLKLPVMQYSDSSKNCITKSPDLGGLIPMLQSTFLTKPRLVNMIKSDYKGAKEVSESFRIYTNSEDSLPRSR